MPYRPDDPAFGEAERTILQSLTWPEWVTIRRLRLGWTKDDLAARCESTRMTLWRIEMGRSRPNAATMKVIELALDEGERELVADGDAVGAGTASSA